MFANFPQGSRGGSRCFASPKITARLALALAAALTFGLSLSSARANMGPAPAESTWFEDSNQVLDALRPAYAPAVFDTHVESQASLATFIGHQVDSSKLSISLAVPTDAPSVADPLDMLPVQPSPMLALLSESADAQVAAAAGFLSHQWVNINALLPDENRAAELTALALPPDAATELFFHAEPMFALGREEFFVPARREDEKAG